MQIHERAQYDPRFSSVPPAMPYSLEMRRAAVAIMNTVVERAIRSARFYDPQYLCAGFKVDDLDVYGFLRAQEWLGLGVPTVKCGETSGYLKFLTEFVPFTRQRPVDGFPRSASGGGIYVSNDISAFAVMCSGLQWRPQPNNRAGVLVAVSFPRRVKNKPLTNCFPHCILEPDWSSPLFRETPQ